MKEVENLEFKPVYKDTPEEFMTFLADLKDFTEPTRHNNAWTRLWTQIQILARYFISKVRGTVQDAEDLTMKAMSDVFRKILSFEIKDREHCAGQFYKFLKSSVTYIWMKIKGKRFVRGKIKPEDTDLIVVSPNTPEKSTTVGRSKEDLDKEYQDNYEKTTNRPEKVDPEGVTSANNKTRAILYYLDLFSKESPLKAEVLRKAVFIIEDTPDFKQSRDVKRLLGISRETFWRYCEDFKSFVAKQPGSTEEGLL